jgi:4-diphosphocytidyl-2-C-methyl-D-erythritol kinase
VRRAATAKLNLALVVGPRREDGKHELVTVLQRLDLADRIALEPAARLEVTGFEGDTIVRRALELFVERAGVPPAFRVTITKRIPVAAGLGGGSSDAATALRLANATLENPLPQEALEELAGEVGADVPFLLRDGPQLGEGAGERLTPLSLPQDYWVVLALPDALAKASSGVVYSDFDTRGGERGYEERRAALLQTLQRVRRPRDLAALPSNDLASSPLAEELREHGAFRADVTGAGPAVYGLFHHREPARRAQDALRRRGRAWLTLPAWYG